MNNRASTPSLPPTLPPSGATTSGEARSDSAQFDQSERVPLAEIMVGQFPDWFPDPTSQTAERFWNGSKWTDHSRIAIPSTGPDGAPNLDRSLRLEDFLKPVEPIILAILGAPDLRDPEPQALGSEPEPEDLQDLQDLADEPNDVLNLFGR